MLSTDTKVLNILLKAKKEGHPLLKYYNIKYPDKTINQEKNSIHVACVNAENNEAGLDHQTFTDLVEIVITSKTVEYPRAVQIIKTVTKEIIYLLKNDPYLAQRLVVRSISPIYEKDTYILKKGHIILQFKTDPVKWDDDDEEFDKVCKWLLKDIEVK